MKWTAACLVLLLNIFHCYAQKPLSSNLFMKKLSNGLEVLVVEDNSVPLATLEMAVKNGAYTESPEYNGLSHLYEHMFFKANKKYSNQGEFIDRMQELGISWNANTSDEMVNYYFTLPKYNLKPGLELMNSAVRYPAFNSTEIEKENAVVDGEFQRHESNPLWQLNDAMNHHLWGEGYSRKNVIGDHDIIRSATSDKMEEIRNRYYWPNNSLLIVAGDVLHEEVFQQAQKVFGDWKPSGFDPFERYEVPEFKPLEKSDYFVVGLSNVQQPMLLFSWQGPDTRRDTLNTYVADIFSYILMQNSSKFHRALVESGLALDFTANYSTKKYTGPIAFLITPNPGKIKECVAAFNEQLRLLDSDDYFTDDQLAVSKKQYEIRSLREEEVTSQFTHTLAYWFCSASIDYFNTYLDNLNKVSPEDIKNYVRKYIKGRPLCAGLLLNPSTRAGVSPETFFKSE
ncbi:MAG TPA: pitrilysin family protein [Puia sp.]